MNREPININTDDVKYEALKACQDKFVKNNDTQRLTSFPIGYILTMLHEDGRLRMHGVIKEANSSGHRGRSYIISDEDGQTNNTEHEAHKQHPNTYREYQQEQIK